jgi:TIR domain
VPLFRRVNNDLSPQEYEELRNRFKHEAVNVIAKGKSAEIVFRRSIETLGQQVRLSNIELSSFREACRFYKRQVIAEEIHQQVAKIFVDKFKVALLRAQNPLAEEQRTGVELLKEFDWLKRLPSATVMADCLAIADKYMIEPSVLEPNVEIFKSFLPDFKVNSKRCVELRDEECLDLRGRLDADFTADQELMLRIQTADALGSGVESTILASDVLTPLPSSPLEIAPQEEPEVLDAAPILLFVSHSSHDSEVAKALIEVLLVAEVVMEAEVRCTSIPGYQLSVGAQFVAEIRELVSEATVFLGLVSWESAASSWVLFELGARWGANKSVLPLLLNGFSANDLPGPISGTNACDCRDLNSVSEFLKVVSRSTGRMVKNGTRLTTNIQTLNRRAALPW